MNLIISDFDGTFYDNNYEENIKFMGKYITDTYSTREKASAGICSTVLNSINRKGFKLTKQEIGDCWVYDCLNASISSYICDKCTFCMKGCTFKEKIDDLDKNSVSCFSAPTSTIFT